MANNFAEAFLGARNAAIDRGRQQQADARTQQAFDVQMQGAQQKQQTDQREALYNLATGYESYVAQNPQGGQQYYETFLRPSLAGLGLGDSGPYDANAVSQVAKQVIAAYRPQTAQGALAPRVVGDALVDPTGKVLYQSPQQQDYQWSDRAGAWIPKPMGGSPQTQAAPSSSPSSAGGQLDFAGDLRQFASLGVPVSSTRRTQAKNNEVGGVGDSYHLTGEAADIVPRNAQEKQQSRQYWESKGYQVIDEGDHLHIEPPRRGMTSSQVGGGGLTAIPVAGVGPKQDEQYATLSAQEVQALGLPQGTVAQRSPAGQVQIINKPRDLPSNGQVIDNGDGTTTFIPAGKTTEGERNAAGFYQRMVNATDELAKLTNAGYSPNNTQDRFGAALDDTPLIGGLLAPIGRAATSPEGQQYQQAAMNWIRANLRKESGAAIGVKEANDEYRNYFPVLGDGPDVIAQKARNRAIVEQAMRSAAGGALPPPASSRASGGYQIGQIIEANGKRYRITGLDDPNDPDVEEVR